MSLVVSKNSLRNRIRLDQLVRNCQRHFLVKVAGMGDSVTKEILLEHFGADDQRHTELRDEFRKSRWR